MKKFTKLTPKKWIVVICMNLMLMPFSALRAEPTIDLTQVNSFTSGYNQDPHSAAVNTAQTYFEPIPTAPGDQLFDPTNTKPRNLFDELPAPSEDFIFSGTGPMVPIDQLGNENAAKQDNATILPEIGVAEINETQNEMTAKVKNRRDTASSPSPTPTNIPAPNAPEEAIQKASVVTDGAPKAIIVKEDGTDPAIPGPYCEKGAKHGKKPRGDSTYMDNEVLFPGSSGLNQCEKLSLGHMKNLYKNGSRTDAIEDWSDFLAYSCKDSCSNPTEYNECLSKKLKSARMCESIAYLLSVNDRDWNDSEKNQADQKGTTSVTTGIVCKSAGIETLDYEPCMKFAKNIDTVEAVQQIAQGTQQMIYQDKMIDAQAKYVNEANAAKGALKGQKDSIEMQQEMYQQRTAVDAAKLALLASAYQGMPSFESVSSQCSSMPLAEITPGNQLTRADCTTAARAGQSNFALLMNSKETEKMKTKMIAVAAQAGSSALLASLLGKRAKDIGKAIAKIDAFVPLDPLAPVQDDLTSTFCKQNPALPECLTAGLDRTYDPLADNIITFGEGGQGTNYGTPNTNADGSSSGGISDGATARESVGSVGSVVSAAVQDDSIEASTAATVSSGATGSRGGGGGGGGGGVGSGGGGAPIGSGTPGGTQAAIQGKTPSYAGGAGSLSMMGGFGIKPKAANGKEENPFGKLFGKDGAKNSVVNFRDIASQKVGDKGDNLFDMISKRYTTVNADKRLIEYELAK